MYKPTARVTAGIFRKMSTTSSKAYKQAGELLNPSKTAAKIVKKTLLTNENARFINLCKLDYVSPLGINSAWEMAQRTTKPAGQEVDAVIIIPLLKYPNGDKKVVLVRQFRPPTGGVCVEFPAGLVDPNDTIESCALRELKEETGYVGTIRKKSGVVWSDPGLTDANCEMVYVDVDMSLPENQQPVPQWMDSEVIEVVSVHTSELEETINNWNNEGYLIDAKVQSVLIGMSL